MKIATRIDADDRRRDAGPDRIRAEAGVDDAAFDHLQLRGQRAGPQHDGQRSASCMRELPVIWPLPPMIGELMIGRRDDAVVEHDGEGPADIGRRRPPNFWAPGPCSWKEMLGWLYWS